MNVYTVSFFGHREIDNFEETEKRLTDIVHNIIKSNDYVKFLVGRNGEFDWLASAVISRVTHGYQNSYTVLVLPYMKASYRDHRQNFECCYNEVEICPESSSAHYKSAIQICNRSMIDRSDLVICCIQHNSGGAYKAVQYAVKQNKKIVNIAEQKGLKLYD